MDCLKEYDSKFEYAKKTVDNAKIEKLVLLLQKARDKRKPILIIGNGGSSTTASHFSLDLNKSTVKNLNAINEKYASTQVLFYALMLSKRTGIPLEYFRCGYFDNLNCYLFKPEDCSLPQLKSIQEFI